MIGFNWSRKIIMNKTLVLAAIVVSVMALSRFLAQTGLNGEVRIEMVSGPKTALLSCSISLN
jgi:hypothetical protein